MAIDRKAILDAVFQGSGAPAKNLIPPTIAWAWDPATPDYVYDPAAAKTLLARAGFPNGFETELWAMPVQRPYNPDAHRTAELIQADLAKIGITAKIVSYEWGEYRKRAQAGEAPMAQLGWTGDNGDPDNFFQPLASCTAARPGGGNIAKWCNQEFQKRIDLAATISDQPQRARLYREAQAIMHEEDPFYLIAHSVVFMPMRANVIGYQMSPFGRHQFTEVDLK
jgi:dipeptide transport system substrate-binding protein